MPTARSWTDGAGDGPDDRPGDGLADQPDPSDDDGAAGLVRPATLPVATPPDERRMPRVIRDLPGSVADLHWLLSFRRSSLTRRQGRRLRVGALVVLALTAAAAVVPAYARRLSEGDDLVPDLLLVLPTFYLAFLALAVVSSVASGGGRELVPREQAVPFPISTWTEHFGALLLAPLNIAWLLQAWTLLGATSYVLGPANLWASVLPVLCWIAVATAWGQAVGWAIEAVRRSAHGVALIRGLVGVLGVAAVVLVGTGRLGDLLDQSPTTRILIAAANGTGGAWRSWAFDLALLALLLLVGIAVGGLTSRWALRRPPRDEARLDSGTHQPRPNPATELVAMLRMDRASVWRSVPLRRGILVLALLPGLVAAAGALRWDLVTILPGLVASGGGLLFGVNAWCLDGRGALWRDTLPVDQRLVFVSKVVVLFEVLLAAAGITILLAAFRAGVPNSAELAATVCAALVVATAVVSGAMRWSVDRPFAVDLRSARATPAPPVVMVGYSTRLALTTTFIGLLFSAAAYTPDWRYPVVLAVPLLSFSTLRLLRTARRWADPVTRARVVAVVAS